MTDPTTLIAHIRTTLADASRCHALHPEPAWFGVERALRQALIGLEELAAQNEILSEARRAERRALVRRIDEYRADRDALAARQARENAEEAVREERHEAWWCPVHDAGCEGCHCPKPTDQTDRADEETPA